MIGPALVLSLATAAVAQDTTLTARIAAYLAPLDAAGELHGTLLVARGGEVVFERAYGMADPKRGARNSPETLFATASLSKPLTGLILNQLMERGVIAGSDPISKWLPDFPRGSEITVNTLRGHRSGIPHRVMSADEELVRRTTAEMVSLISRQPLRFDPGTQMLYSSAGYTVLARVIELATGRPYAQMLRDLVLTPAGTRLTFDASERPADDRVAVGYVRGAGGMRDTPRKDFSFLTGAGSLHSTPRELFAIVRALLDGKYGPASLDAVQQGRGIAWNGFSNGYRAFVSHDLSSGVTMIFTSNIRTGAGDLIRRDVPRLIAGETLVATAPRAAAHPLPAALQARYSGTYEIGGSPAELRFESPTLATMGPEYVLIPIDDRTFFSPQDYAELTVQQDDKGAVTGLLWKFGEQTFPIRRL